MIIGVPTEIKSDEFRVAITPAGVRELVGHGHRVVIQSEAGEGSSISNAEYEAQGAEILQGPGRLTRYIVKRFVFQNP